MPFRPVGATKLNGCLPNFSIADRWKTVLQYSILRVLLYRRTSEDTSSYKPALCTYSTLVCITLFYTMLTVVPWGLFCSIANNCVQCEAINCGLKCFSSSMFGPSCLLEAYGSPVKYWLLCVGCCHQRRWNEWQVLRMYSITNWTHAAAKDG